MSLSMLDVPGIPITPKNIADFAKEWFSTDVVREKSVTLLQDGEKEEQQRGIGCSHWVEKKDAQYESALIRACFACFDTIYNFLVAGEAPEKAFFSIHVRIRDGHKRSSATDHGHTLALRSIDEPDIAFDNTARLIYHTRTLAQILEDDHAGNECTVVVDTSICDSPESPRSTADRNGFIQMTKVAIRALFQIARVDFNVEPVRVVPGETFIPPETAKAVAFITADWDNAEGEGVKLVRKARKITYDNSTDIDALLKEVEELRIEGNEKKNIFLLGNTGAGKSHSGNWILDVLRQNDTERFSESDSGSMTSYVDFLPRADDAEWRVWDTPGLNDSYGRDDKFVHDIERSISDASRIHAVILCCTSLERIDSTMKRSLRLFSRIVGQEMHKCLLIFVNRQNRPVSTLQKKNLSDEIRLNCGFSVDTSHIFDMSPRSSQNESRKDAASLLFKYCKEDGIKVGQIADVMKGLKELSELKDGTKLEIAKLKLIDKSASALGKVLVGRDERHPLKVQPSFGTSVILTSGKVYEFGDGVERSIEYHLEMPQHIRKRFDRRFVLFGKCLCLWNADVEKVIKVVKSMRLVYRKLPEERSESRRLGVLHQVYKVHLQLWGIDDALLADTKHQVQRLLGAAGPREVSIFDESGKVDNNGKAE